MFAGVFRTLQSPPRCFPCCPQCCTICWVLADGRGMTPYALLVRVGISLRTRTCHPQCRKVPSLAPAPRVAASACIWVEAFRTALQKDQQRKLAAGSARAMASLGGPVACALSHGPSWVIIKVAS